MSQAGDNVNIDVKELANELNKNFEREDSPNEEIKYREKIEKEFPGALKVKLPNKSNVDYYKDLRQLHRLHLELSDLYHKSGKDVRANNTFEVISDMDMFNWISGLIISSYAKTDVSNKNLLRVLMQLMSNDEKQFVIETIDENPNDFLDSII
jgi:hypothetical protein